MGSIIFRLFNKIKLHIYSLQFAHSPTKGNEYYLYGGFDLIHASNFHFGDGLSVNSNVYINARSKIILGRNVALSNGAMLITTGLSFTEKGLGGHITKEIIIGDNVQVGAGSIILQGVSICSNVIVGAGSVVSRSIEEPGIYVGSPAKILEKK